MKKTIIALLLAASALFAVNVSAEEAVQNDTVVEEIAPLVLEGLKQIKVTSSDSSIPGITEKIDTSLIFDGLSSTGCTIEFVDAAEGEEGESDLPVADEKTVSIYTSSGTPHSMRALSLLLEGELGTLLSINVYATNDNLLLDWTQLSFTNMKGTENSGYYVFNIDGKIDKYVFYRIDISVESGSSFSVNEIDLYKSDADMFEYYYVFDGDIEPGETPEIERVLIEEPEEIKDVPMFGLSGFPGAVRPVPYK